MFDYIDHIVSKYYCSRKFLLILVLLQFSFIGYSSLLPYAYGSLRVEDANNPLPAGINDDYDISNSTITTTLKTKRNSVLGNTAAINTDEDAPFTFPSPQERVKYYMGVWYDAPPPNKDSCFDIPIANINTTKLSRESLYSLEVLNATLKMTQPKPDAYIKDSANILNSVESKVDHGTEISKLVVLRTGDGMTRNTYLPVVGKTRSAGAESDRKGYFSIIWPLKLHRHFHSGLEKLQRARDTPWGQKRDAIVWRGTCTGNRHGTRKQFAKKYATHQNKDIDIGMKMGDNLCMDAKYFKHKLSVEEMLKYKYLLSLEGNDVATGLKWQLASSSVVFMPRPTAESFAMEALLVPFVHYIPVKPDGSDVEEMMIWAKQNDEKVRWISSQSSRYMDNLWLSDQAQENNIFIRNQLGNIYHEKFGDVLRECYQKRRDT